jgi:lycopene cyclase domain-containing protein
MSAYTSASLAAVVFAVVIDLWGLRTKLLTTKAFWASWAIVVFFQLIVNGVLTGVGIVQYNPEVIVGVRLFFAPIEDLGFGFALVTLVLCHWVWLGQRAGSRRR